MPGPWGLAALAGRLNTTTTTTHFEAVEAGEQPLTPDQHQHLIDMATAALAGMSRAELRAYREHMGLSQTSLADLLGTNRSTVARAEEGTRAISPAMVALLERLLPEHATAIATLTEHPACLWHSPRHHESTPRSGQEPSSGRW